MKNVFFLAVLGLTLCAPRASAHPPVAAGVIYDPALRTVFAVITHPVSDPEKHYIFKAELLINGKIVKEEFFDRQQDPELQRISYEVRNLKRGDLVEVVGYCNVSGKRGGSVKVQ